MMNPSRLYRLLIGLALLLLFTLALRNVAWNETMQTLKHLTPARVAVLSGINLVILFLFSSRWWLILRLQGYQVSYLELFSYRLAGFGVSYFTPGMQFGGEPLQVHLLQRRQGLSGTSALASVTLDKLFEVASNLSFLALGMILIIEHGHFSGGQAWQLGLALAALLVLPFAYLFALRSGGFPLSRIAAHIPVKKTGKSFLPRIFSLLEANEQQVSGLLQRDGKMVIVMVFLSTLIWVLITAEYWLSLAFLGERLDFFQTITALTAARLAFLTPFPGGLGVLETSQVLAMQTLGLNPSLGISISLLIRARDLTFASIGLWSGGWLSRGRRPIRLSKEPSRPEIST